MSTFDVIGEAIATKSQIIARYRGYHRELFPHALGYKHGTARVLCYQFGGSSSTGLPPGGEWRCMIVAELQDVEIQDGEWHTGANHTQPQTCIDVLVAEVSY
jgi:hypothetical protein